MEEQIFALDDPAQLALEVARHAALANGDSHCGTEYLLYGLVATARGEVVELMDLFTLNTLRVDRAIERFIERRGIDPMHAGAPRLTQRAVSALNTPRLDGTAPTGIFELLHGVLADDDSGACSVLRDLGVQPVEARRLVSYGMRHLSKDEVDALLASLDRRGTDHRGWWGPDPRRRVVAVDASSTLPMVIASSDSAQVEVTALGSDGEGLGFTLTVRSLRSWVLPPVFLPEEALIPGQGAEYNNGPDFFLLQITLPDGTVLDNRTVNDRFSASTPPASRLQRIGQRNELVSLNDRRQPDRHVITGDWWLWPMLDTDSITISVDWPAEAVSGQRNIALSSVPSAQHSSE